MTIEPLLIPRIKIITRWPMMSYQLKEGMILSLDKFGAGKWWHEHTEDEPLHLEESSATTYPKNLKLLEWWEERNVDEMIQVKYVKITTYVAYWRVGDIVGVIEYKIDGAGKFRKYVLDYNYLHSPDTVEPSTRDQYEAQKK